MFRVHTQRFICILLIWYSSSRNSWIWCTTQVLSAFFNTCQIDRSISCILHFHGHHQCRVVRSRFIYELVTSTKLAFLSLQNSRCKYYPMPSEFQFKKPPLALRIPKSCLSWCMDIFWNCPFTSTHFNTWVERGTTKVFWQEHYTTCMSSFRAPFQTAWFRDGCTNSEATAPSCWVMEYMYMYM